VADEAEATADADSVADEAEATADAEIVIDEAEATADSENVTDEAEATVDSDSVADEAEAPVDSDSVADEAEAPADADSVADEAEAPADTDSVVDEAEATADADSVTDEAGATADANGVADQAREFNEIMSLKTSAIESSTEQFLSSIFDFSVDPYGLVEMSAAQHYGGGIVEPDAKVIFRNHEGQYDFSSQSDAVVLSNLQDEPLMVTVSVSLNNLNKRVQLVSKEQKSDPLTGEKPMLYLAVIDSLGHEIPILTEKPVRLSTILSSSDNLNNNQYYFKLCGDCNPNGNWENVAINATISVMWEFHPVPTESEVSNAELTTVNDHDESIKVIEN
ncbi:MAG: hypothetical protein IJQ81_06105, partial [Oscillibacter sp.]|nr:hypothetical protein [Oscillibacter sp.]